MASKAGRLERRIRLVLPVEIASVRNPTARERGTTENVCSLGVRVVTRRTMEPNEPVRFNSLAGDMRATARVVYCQRLPDGRFGIGLQFQEAGVKWPNDLPGVGGKLIGVVLNNVDIFTDGYYNYGPYGGKPAVSAQEPLVTPSFEVSTQQRAGD